MLALMIDLFLIASTAALTVAVLRLTAVLQRLAGGLEQREAEAREGEGG